jgi:hypothetical protein
MERTANRLKENESLRQRIKELEAEKEQLQKQTEQLSDLPLEYVAWQLGLFQDNSSYRCWKGGEHIIHINGSHWSHLASDTQKTGAAQKISDVAPDTQNRLDAPNTQTTANSQKPSGITDTGAVALVKHVNCCNFMGVRHKNKIGRYTYEDQKKIRCHYEHVVDLVQGAPFFLFTSHCNYYYIMPYNEHFYSFISSNGRFVRQVRDESFATARGGVSPFPQLWWHFPIFRTNTNHSLF